MDSVQKIISGNLLRQEHHTALKQPEKYSEELKNDFISTQKPAVLGYKMFGGLSEIDCWYP